MVVPVLSPYPKLQNFDIPKIPILSAKLSNSNGSNSGEAYVSFRRQLNFAIVVFLIIPNNFPCSLEKELEDFFLCVLVYVFFFTFYVIDQQNSSNDSTSLKALDQQTNGTGMRRPKMTGSVASFAPYQEPDSPQSSMTSSGFTSVSRNNGRGSMPNAPFKRYFKTFYCSQRSRHENSYASFFLIVYVNSF